MSWRMRFARWFLGWPPSFDALMDELASAEAERDRAENLNANYQVRMALAVSDMQSGINKLRVWEAE